MTRTNKSKLTVSKVRSKLISYLLAGGFLALFIWYFTNNKEDFALLFDIRMEFIALVAIGHIATIASNGLLIKWLVEGFNKRISIYEGSYAALLSSIGNFFLPAGSGMVFRAIYLKRKIKFNYKSFITITYGNYMIMFFCFGLLGLLSLFMLRNSSSNTAFMVLGIIFLSMVIGTGYLSLFQMPKSVIDFLNRQTKLKTLKLIRDVLAGWNVISKHRKLLLRMLIITITWFFTTVLVAYAAIYSLDLTVGVWALMLYSAMGSIILFINITPGSIGVRESVLIFASGLLGFTTPEILAISIVERGVKFLVLVIGWALTYVPILKRY